MNMDRKKLIDRLVDRKLTTAGADKAFCLCMAAPQKAAPKK
jgi:hypothetical protein